MAEDEVRKEEFHVTGDALVAKIKELLHEGNIRRITLKTEDGKILIEFPLTVGGVGVLLLPAWAALGAVAALVAKCTIVIERVDVPASVSPEEPAEEDHA
jgi:hypothetical protein